MRIASFLCLSENVTSLLFARRISRGTSSRDSYHIFLFHGAGKTIKRRHINNHSFAGGSLLAQARLFFPLTFLFPPNVGAAKTVSLSRETDSTSKNVQLKQAVSVQPISRIWNKFIR